MTLLNLIKRNLSYYGRKNFFLALGIAVSTAVLVGALIVGDSVKYSLNRIVDHRLGEITHVMKAGDRFFTTALAEKAGENLKAPSSPVLLLEAIATADGGKKRINNTQVIGIDSTFGPTVGQHTFFKDLSDEEVIISQNLATRLDVSGGDEILLRITKASLIPLNAPFVSDAENIVSVRVTIKDIADEDHLGRFNLKISQTAPFNLFISLETLNEIMELEHKANAILFSEAGTYEPEEIMEIIGKEWSITDAGMYINPIDEPQVLEVTSHRVFLDDIVTAYPSKGDGLVYPVLTYFVNTLESASGRTPYSFVSTLPDASLGNNEIIINEWLASDLGISAGDSLEISYFVVGPLRELTVDSLSFLVKSVVPMEGIFADQSLMPNLPGLSDAGSCRDWETGVPIELESIRDKDEAYWNKWKGTPKAFISISKATELWQNRFGTYTALRYDASETTAGEIETTLLSNFGPEDIGFMVEAVRSDGSFAAQNGVDFSQLFGGLSFFLLVAGILLTVLLLLLNLENRKEQLATLSSLGINIKLIRRSIFLEGLVISFAGALIGLLLAILYNKLVFSALNGVWRDIVRTEMMFVYIRIPSLLIGLLISMAVASLTIYLSTNRFLKRTISLHLKKPVRSRKGMHSSILLSIAILSGMGGLAMIIYQLVIGDIINASIFFLAGAMFLISSLVFSSYFMGKAGGHSDSVLNYFQLSRRNALRNKARSMSIVILFAIGTFLVISTGSNRKDLFQGADDPTSGTGGFLYFAESTVPVLHKLNNPQVRIDFGLEGNYSIAQMRKASGDDASCLNLNKIVNPQILGVDPISLEGRFSFVTRTDLLDPSSPWQSLEQELPGGLIPAIADETVIKWGLGLTVGDTLTYQNANGEVMHLLLIGGLAPSIFQGNVLISDAQFLKNFPQSSGTEVFLVGGNLADTAIIEGELNRGLRDFGWDMTLSAARLTEFNSVTNTYLSIFMVMGALGLLIGTIGLAVLLARSILEREKEIALLKAVGYSRKRIGRLIFNEYMGLFLIGTVAGFLSAVVATLPSFISDNSEISISSVLWILMLLLANGWIWIFLITRINIGKLSINEALRND